MNGVEGQGSLEPDPSDEDISEHREIPDQAVQRILESSRPVLLKKEMPHPGKSVSDERQQPQTQVAAGHQRIQDSGNDERSANEVQAPAGLFTVLGQVEGIELTEALVTVRHYYLPLPSGGASAA